MARTAPPGGVAARSALATNQRLRDCARIVGPAGERRRLDHEREVAEDQVMGGGLDVNGSSRTSTSPSTRHRRTGPSRSQRATGLGDAGRRHERVVHEPQRLFVEIRRRWRATAQSGSTSPGAA